MSRTLNETPGRVCGECRFFLYPEKSILYKHELVTRCCPHSCHRLEDGGGYATSNMRACASFELKTQLTLF